MRSVMVEIDQELWVEDGDSCFTYVGRLQHPLVCDGHFRGETVVSSAHTLSSRRILPLDRYGILPHDARTL